MQAEDVTKVDKTTQEPLTEEAVGREKRFAGIPMVFAEKCYQLYATQPTFESKLFN